MWPKRCVNPECRRWILPKIFPSPEACRRECNAEVARLLKAHYGGAEEPTPPRPTPTLPRLLWETPGAPGRCGSQGVCERFPWCNCAL